MHSPMKQSGPMHESALPTDAPERDAISGDPRTNTRTARQSGVWGYRSLIWNFTTRDLKSRYKGTVIGWAWSFVVPLSTVVTYSVVFSLFIRIEPPPFGNGKPGVYAVWLLVGMVTWAFISNAASGGMPSLLGNGPLMQKVYIPAFVPVIATGIAIAIQSAIELGLVLIILAAFGNIGPTWLLVPVWLALLVATTIAMSFVLAVTNVHWRDLAQIVVVMLQLLFFLSPIIYPLSLVPETVGGLPVRMLIEVNPITQFIVVGRQLLYDLTMPTPGQALYLLGCTIGALLLAGLVYRRWGQDVGEAV